MTRYTCLNTSNNTTQIFTQNELLAEINRDRSEAWTPYTLEDLDDNIQDALSLTDLDLIEVCNY